ncbi:MAG: hypothetical protein HY067_12650 [Betaproteobacteria bacterium]|nr:hypothetical protein [Betaproteobacteria bacterium]
MYLVRSLFAAFLATVALSNYAFETVPTPKEARAITDKIMAKVGVNDLDAAIKLLKPFTIVPEAEVDATFGQFKLQQSMIAQRFGASLGTEFVREEKVGESLLRITHIHRFDKHAMRWMFYFYRSNKGWVLNTFRFDDNIVALFP